MENADTAGLSTLGLLRGQGTVAAVPATAR